MFDRIPKPDPSELPSSVLSSVPAKKKGRIRKTTPRYSGKKNRNESVLPVPSSDMPEEEDTALPPMTMTVSQLTYELHINLQAAYKLVKQEDFPCFTIGQKILISREGLQHWIDEQCAKPKSYNDGAAEETRREKE